MELRHERPDSQTAFKVRAPLRLILSKGEVVQIRDWSMKGFTATTLSKKNLDDTQIAVPFQGFEVKFPVKLQPGREEGEWHFGDLDGRQREVLGLFYRNLLSGKMASTANVITALDTPVDLVPMGETEEEIESGTADMPPRLLRVIFNATRFILLFALVAGYIGWMSWNKIDNITLQHARFVAPITEITSSGAGFVRTYSVKEGDEVRAGDLLAELSNSNTERAMSEVRADIKRGEIRRSELIAKLDNVEQLEEKLFLLPEDSAAKLSELSRRRDRLTSELTLIDIELRALRKDRGSLRQAQQSLQIRAPRDGRVLRAETDEGAYVSSGKPVLSFEDDRPRLAIGWLSDELAVDVWEGMRADIIFSRHGSEHRHRGVVVQIEAGQNEARPDPWGLVVQIALDGVSTKASRELLVHNAPTKVLLKRDLFARGMKAVSHWWPL